MNTNRVYSTNALSVCFITISEIYLYAKKAWKSFKYKIIIRKPQIYVHIPPMSHSLYILYFIYSSANKIAFYWLFRYILSILCCINGQCGISITKHYRRLLLSIRLKLECKLYSTYVRVCYKSMCSDFSQPNFIWLVWCMNIMNIYNSIFSNQCFINTTNNLFRFDW